MKTQATNTKGKTTRGVRSRLAAMAVGAAIVAGCAPDLEVRPPATSIAQWIQLSHKVAFAPGQARLSAEAARGIDAFVHRAEIAYGDRIVVKGGAATGSPAEQALAAARARAVIEHLRRHRIPSRFSPAAPVAVGANEAAILVGRYIAVAPSGCPQWSDTLAGGDLSNEGNRYGIGLIAGDTAPSPLGCVTASALGAQLADPGDLVDGGKIGPGDGEFFSRGMRRYREDNAKETEAINTGGGSQ